MEKSCSFLKAIISPPLQDQRATAMNAADGKDAREWWGV